MKINTCPYCHAKHSEHYRWCRYVQEMREEALKAANENRTPENNQNTGPEVL